MREKNLNHSHKHTILLNSSQWSVKKKKVQFNRNPKLQARNSYLFLRPTVSQQPNRSYITRIFSTSTSKIRFFQRIKPLKIKPHYKKSNFSHN